MDRLRFVTHKPWQDIGKMLTAAAIVATVTILLPCGFTLSFVGVKAHWRRKKKNVSKKTHTITVVARIAIRLSCQLTLGFLGSLDISILVGLKAKLIIRFRHIVSRTQSPKPLTQLITQM